MYIYIYTYMYIYTLIKKWSVGTRVSTPHFWRLLGPRLVSTGGALEMTWAISLPTSSLGSFLGGPTVVPGALANSVPGKGLAGHTVEVPAGPSQEVCLCRF